MKGKIVLAVIMILAALGLGYLAARSTANSADSGGLTPLHYAAMEGSAGKTAWYLAIGAKIDVRANGGQTALHLAQDPDVVTVLVQHHADLNAQNDTGGTPLHIAAGQNLPDVVQRLIELGADVNARDKAGDTPLHMAVRGEDNTTINLLLAHGAKLNARNALGQTPLQLAQKKKAKEIVKILTNFATHKTQ